MNDKTFSIRGSLPLIIFLLALFAIGCDTVDEQGPGGGEAARVFVANQGNFGDGNGSISVYDPESEDAQPAAITGLGSIVQSVTVTGDRLYVLANSGNRIDVYDREALQQVAQIDEVISPRYMIADGETGYVTNLYGSTDSFTGGKVTVLDLDASEKVVEIPVGNNPEGLALVGARLYVANHGFGSGSTLSVIDTATRTVVDTIDVACDGPRFLIADAEDELFVFCTGQTLYDMGGQVIGTTDGAVRILDGETGSILERISIDGQIGTAAFGQDAFHAPGLEQIFVVKDEQEILSFDTDRNVLEGSIGPLEGGAISAVAYATDGDRLYVGRANGFTAAGSVSIHARDGQELGRFSAGVMPTYIAIGSGE